MWSDHTTLKESAVTGARQRTHERVVGHIEDELRAGRLHVGSRISGERALADTLGVSRASVREGLRVLEAMGLVRTSVGSGPESGAVVVADTAAAMTSALRLHLASTSLPVSDVVETRLLIETWAIRQAARRQDGGALARAAELLETMKDPTLDAEAFHQLDAEFHLTLARAAGNEVVASIMTSLRGAIHEYVMAAVSMLPDWPSVAAKLRRQHRALLGAVQAGDGERAARLVAAHIEGFYTMAMRNDKGHPKRSPAERPSAG
jgi:GntR family transcriptional repressor for pyruvate dehydrogenase complex